jgi:hypothetical protein
MLVILRTGRSFLQYYLDYLDCRDILQVTLVFIDMYVYVYVD